MLARPSGGWQAASDGHEFLFWLLITLVTAISVISIAANVSFLYLIKFAGPVFASQTAYVQALSGIVCGMLLLGETMTALAWVAIFLVLVGMYLVESKASEEPITIKRDFVRS